MSEASQVEGTPAEGTAEGEEKRTPGRPITVYDNYDAAKAANEDRPLFHVKHAGTGLDKVVACSAPVIAIGAAFQTLGATVERLESKRKDAVQREAERIGKMTPEEKEKLRKLLASM